MCACMCVCEREIRETWVNIYMTLCALMWEEKELREQQNKETARTWFGFVKKYENYSKDCSACWRKKDSSSCLKQLCDWGGVGYFFFSQLINVSIEIFDTGVA